MPDSDNLMYSHDSLHYGSIRKAIMFCSLQSIIEINIILCRYVFLLTMPNA